METYLAKVLKEEMRKKGVELPPKPPSPPPNKNQVKNSSENTCPRPIKPTIKIDDITSGDPVSSSQPMPYFQSSPGDGPVRAADPSIKLKESIKSLESLVQLKDEELAGIPLKYEEEIRGLREDLETSKKHYEEEIRALKEDIETRKKQYGEEIRALLAEVETHKNTLRDFQSINDGRNGGVDRVALRNTVVSVLSGSPRLTEVVGLIDMLYPERIVFLQSARDSAKKSERGGFCRGREAYQLLQKLVNDYWQQLAEGKSDKEAKTVFGQKVYAPKEASGMSQEGKSRRIFRYRNQDILMEKHLKIGVKDSFAETLRVHFEWVAEEKKIIVGHCGKHLDF